MQHASEALETIVAGLVSVPVVDSLEVVEIEKEDRRAGRMNASPHLGKRAPVGQSGQWIAVDELLQHFLRGEEADIRLRQLVLNGPVENEDAAECDDPFRAGIER